MPSHRGINIPASLDFESTAAAIDALGVGWMEAELSAAIGLLDRLQITSAPPQVGEVADVPAPVFPRVSAAMLTFIMHAQTVFDDVVPNLSLPLGSLSLIDGDSQSSLTIVMADSTVEDSSISRLGAFTAPPPAEPPPASAVPPGSFDPGLQTEAGSEEAADTESENT